MAETRKVLGQSAPSAATLTTLYTVPASTQAIASTINVCNRSSTATTFRISVAVAGAADATSQYLVYDTQIAGNDSIAFTIGMTLGAADVVRCYATLATVTFALFGVELT
jgi:glucose-6-phosphate dehydrogenase assembly protein OpcA